MSLKFTALEVGSGDAFLLEDEDRKILFDSGGNQNLIVRLLKKKKIKKIDLAICSHNDIDHANGFIGLLNSEIKINEIWMPGLWANVLQFVKDFCTGEDIILFHEDCDGNKEFDDIDFNSLYNKELEPVPYETFDDELSFFAELIDSNWFHCWELFYYVSFRFHKHEIAPAFGLKRIIEIAGLAYQKGCKIRWFEPSSTNKSTCIDYDLYALNSAEICYIQKIKNEFAFMQALTLTKENKYSLVFEFIKNNDPIIRFSADSDCELQSKKPYNNIIITAPHHGSEANANVYKPIQGKNIIWVRSDRMTLKRPCDDFKRLPNKFCLACHTLKFKSEICFEYDDNTKHWLYRRSTCCICKP